MYGSPEAIINLSKLDNNVYIYYAITSLNVKYTHIM